VLQAIISESMSNQKYVYTKVYYIKGDIKWYFGFM